MVDITHKNNTLREAVAQAIVKVGSLSTIKSIVEKKIPKGDVFEMAKAAGLLAVKKTSDLIPDCHPLPIEYAKVEYDIVDLEIKIKMCVKTIYKTGVEVEAMHGVSVVALTIYDMLKPIDKEIEIHHIKLLEKKGGKSDFPIADHLGLKATVVVYSQAVVENRKSDTAGQLVKEKLSAIGLGAIEYLILPQSSEELEMTIKSRALNGHRLIIVVGGTGAGKTDDSPEVIRKLIDKEFPGIMEAARAFGHNRSPKSMFSRSVAGIYNQTLLMAIPGSTHGAKDTLDAILPGVLHLLNHP